MVFNIAAASLIIQNFHSRHVTYTEFALCITELVLVCLCLLGTVFGLISLLVIPKDRLYYRVVPIYMLVLLIYIFNVIYSSYLIIYYDNDTKLTEPFYPVSIAIIAANSFLILCQGFLYHF